MVLRKATEDREHDAFCLDSDGLTAKRTCTEITGGTIDVEATPGGLSGGFLVTTLDIGDTATLIPVTSSNSISIANMDLVDTLYIGPANTVTADSIVGSTSGWEIGQGETINLDFKETVEVYAISPTGTTIRIKVFEAA